MDPDRLLPDFFHIDFFFPFGIFLSFGLFPADQQRCQQGKDTAAAEDDPPVKTEGDQTAGKQHTDQDPHRPEGVGNIHIAFRLIRVQVLNKRSRHALADPLPQTGDRQQRQQQPVNRGKRTEQHTDPHKQHPGAEGQAVTEASGDGTAEKQSHDHGNTADQMEGAALRHTALRQREVQILRHGNDHNGDGERAECVSGERGVCGKIVSTEGEIGDFHNFCLS